MTRKQPVSNISGLRDQAAAAARQAQQAAQQAVQQAGPIARNAGASLQQGTGSAAAWATPKVDAARSWAAPQLEQSARAITESIAPMISNALLTAAQKIDAPKRKSRGSRGGIVAGTVLLTAAAGAGAAAVYAMRHRENGQGVPVAMPDQAGPGQLGPEQTGPARSDLGPAGQPSAQSSYDYDEGAEPDMNGHSRIV